MSEPIRLGLVDDHPVVREGLRAFLESYPDIHIAVEAANGAEALAQLGQTDCDVVLLDLVLRDGMDGIATFFAIRAQHPGTAVLILTSYHDPGSLTQLRDAGAAGYLDKTVQPDDLLTAIRWVARGHTVWEHLPRQASTSEPLTAREQDVLVHLAQGLANKEIAAALGISEKTVKVHVSHILSKLGVYDRTQALIAAHRLGLVRLDLPEP